MLFALETKTLLLGCVQHLEKLSLLIEHESQRRKPECVVGARNAAAPVQVVPACGSLAVVKAERQSIDIPVPSCLQSRDGGDEAAHLPWSMDGLAHHKRTTLSGIEDLLRLPSGVRVPFVSTCTCSGE